MPRFTITLPDGTTVVFGWDPFLGYFCEARRGRRKLVEYDFTTPGYTGLPGLLDALVAAGIFTGDQVEAGLDALLRIQSTDEIQDEHVRAVSSITQKLKLAAGE